MNDPTLFIFSGLPGSGKSTLAKELSKATGATFLRIDTIEQAIRDLCNFKVEGEGYRMSYRIASDNLKLGHNVIADSCNPIELTRKEWNEVTISANANFVNIEVICSEETEHRKRVETRASEVTGLEPPTWEKVANREYHPWVSERIVIDTSKKAIETSTRELLHAIQEVTNV